MRSRSAGLGTLSIRGATESRGPFYWRFLDNHTDQFSATLVESVVSFGSSAATSSLTRKPHPHRSSRGGLIRRPGALLAGLFGTAGGIEQEPERGRTVGDEKVVESTLRTL